MPFHCTTASFAKPVPFTVSVNPPFVTPSNTDVGLYDVTVGPFDPDTIGLVGEAHLDAERKPSIEKVAGAEVCDVAESDTVTVTSCVAQNFPTRSASDKSILTCVGDMYVVVRGDPSQFTTDVFVKLLPVTVNGIADVLFATIDGESFVIVGIGQPADIVFPSLSPIQDKPRAEPSDLET